MKPKVFSVRFTATNQRLHRCTLRHTFAGLSLTITAQCSFVLGLSQSNFTLYCNGFSLRGNHFTPCGNRSTPCGNHFTLWGNHFTLCGNRSTLSGNRSPLCGNRSPPSQNSLKQCFFWVCSINCVIY
jgi:hypothetical protein